MRLWIVLIVVTQMTVTVSSKDWLKWFRAIRLVKMEMLRQRAIGLGTKVPRAFNVITDRIKINVNGQNMYDPRNNGPAEADIINGRGMVLKGTYPISFAVDVPPRKKQRNVCGIVITSSTEINSAYVANMRLFWQSDSRVPWDLIAVPETGEYHYVLALRPGLNTRVLLFDTVPAQHFMVMATSVPGFNINIKLALISECQFDNTVTIVDCSERIDRNPRFYHLPWGVPLNIKCPIDCIRSWPCWGFKVYSTDSPICWAAAQNFGRWGDGSYTIYKIRKVVIFRTEVNPLLTHGIYCRRSIVIYPGFTFDRKYYDITVNEYRDTMGAR